MFEENGEVVITSCATLHNVKEKKHERLSPIVAKPIEFIGRIYIQQGSKHP